MDDKTNEHIQTRMILDYMSRIEDKTSLLFHEYSPTLYERCKLAMDGKIKKSYVINSLTKIIDQLNEHP